MGKLTVGDIRAIMKRGITKKQFRNEAKIESKKFRKNLKSSKAPEQLKRNVATKFRKGNSRFLRLVRQA